MRRNQRKQDQENIKITQTKENRRLNDKVKRRVNKLAKGITDKEKRPNKLDGGNDEERRINKPAKGLNDKERR